MLAINDAYVAVQGEGCLTGQAMTLIRLQGCGVGCPWCDTKETWKAELPDRVGSIAAALGTNPLWYKAAPEEVARFARSLNTAVPWALVTGGEPAEQDLAPLVTALHAVGFRVALETSGTAGGFLAAAFDWVCVSPKLGMPGGKAVLAEAVALADELKMVVGKPADLDALDALLLSHPVKPPCTICLQPLSANPKATALCVETVKARGWRLSIQQHKTLAER